MEQDFTMEFLLSCGVKKIIGVKKKQDFKDLLDFEALHHLFSCLLIKLTILVNETVIVTIATIIQVELLGFIGNILVVLKEEEHKDINLSRFMIKAYFSKHRVIGLDFK